MAESKFLRYQDKTGDGLIDLCDDVVGVVETPACPECTPDPNASVPSWKNQTVNNPWLNEKICKYQVTVLCANHSKITPSNNASRSEVGEYMDAIFKEYEEAAITSLLTNFNKENTNETRQLIRDDLEYSTYDLDVYAGSKVQLLYSLPYDTLAPLPASVEEEEAIATPLYTPPMQGATTVTYLANELNEDLLVLRRALYLYNLYYKVYRSVDKGNLVFDKSGKVFDLEPYGDWKIKLKGTLGTLLKDLDKWLNKKGYNIAFVGTFGPFTPAVTQLKFTFDNKSKLIELAVYTAACGENPEAVFKKGTLKGLTEESEAFRDPTAVNYFIRMKEMVSDLNAREPAPWIEFIKKYTVPAVVEKVNYPLSEEAGLGAAVGACILDNLAEEGKQLGQDILDEAFGLKEAIAFKFNKNLCNQDLQETNAQRAEWGLVYDPHTTEMKTFNDLAIEQAYRDLKEGGWKDQMCAGLFGGASQGGNPTLDQMWRDGFDRIKLCGLQDILLETISCLIKGMTLEQALSKILQAALRAMGITQFGDLIGQLPGNVKYELNKLVKYQLNTNQMLQEGSTMQQISDTASGELEWTEPWQDERYVASQENNEGSSPAQPKVRTLAQQFDLPAIGTSKLNPGQVHEAYILALLEYFADDYFGLLDVLNRYPGAKLIADTLVSTSCPSPPILDPGVFDTISDIQLPICNNTDDIRMPKLKNPFGWIPAQMDWSAAINIALKQALQQAVVTIMTKLMAKLCEIIGSASCTALEQAGDLAAGIPDMLTGQNTFSDIVRETICGEDASQEQVDETVTGLMGLLGPGGAAFADPDTAVQFAADMSGFATRNELLGAFTTGEPSQTFLKGVDNLIDMSYPQYREGLPNKAAIGSFLNNVGNAMPAAVKAQAQDILDELPENDQQPAYPSLCATPEDLENFCSYRTSVLNGRATPTQAAEMCEQIRQDLEDDLGDIAQAAQNGVPPGMPGTPGGPPIVSAPGCDDGLVPFEPEQVTKTATSVVGDGLEQLRTAYITDMMGNGPFESDWGFFNMILADTQGNPYTAHQRKVATDFGKKQYVDFIISGSDDDRNYDKVGQQHGEYPWKVAEWLQTELGEKLQAGNTAINFVATNDYEAETTSSATFSELFGRADPDMTLVPNEEYGVRMETNYDAETIKFISSGRKATPDTTLSFRNNNQGQGDPLDLDFDFGYNIDVFLNDLQGPYTNQEQDNASPINMDISNTRIRISDVTVVNMPLLPLAALLMPSPLGLLPTPSKLVTQKETLYEFLAPDNTLDDFDGDEYPDTAANFIAQRTLAPQVVLLREILNKNGSNIDYTIVNSTYNTIMTSILKTMALEVSGNTEAFLYGARIDTITEDQFEYVVGDGQVSGYLGGTLYAEAEIEDPITGLKRPIRNRDHIFGLSRDQYNNKEAARVLYLHPGTYGGSYLSPPIYVKPIQNAGWLGYVDIAFPELSACKPKNSDMINFGEITDKVQETYSSIPEDERLRGNPDCILEVPYNRILSRPSKAGIETLITATLRIYASAHLTKAIATFTTFEPSFPDVFGPAYARYVVEAMENSLKDAQSNGWEMFTLFKDNEFWYAFLEQAVQTYGRKVDSGQIVAPPAAVLRALNRLNNLQEQYPFYKKKDLKAARKLDDAGLFQGLQSWKEKKVFESIRYSEDDAKIVLTEMMNQELSQVAQDILTNVKAVNPARAPLYTNLAYYMFSRLSQGVSEGFNLSEDNQKEISEVSIAADYTHGGELYVDEDNSETMSAAKKGADYIGYYHIKVDDYGVPQYMAGEDHTSAPHDVLKPYGTQLRNTIGNVEDYPFTADATDTEHPFVLEKYIRLEGVKMSPEEARQLIEANDEGLSLSEVYPGTLAHVLNPGGQVVGLEGKLGVRQGLQFSIMIDGEKRELLSAEVNALDVKINQFEIIRGNTKLLLCLLAQLRDDPTFKLIQNYIFAMNKNTSLLAIYNDISFLPSIGEVTVDTQPIPTPDDAALKPGVRASVVNEGDDENPVYFTSYEYTPGWASYADRQPGRFAGLFVKEWDDWDKILLRNSKAKIKKLFRTYYYSRDFDPKKDTLSGDDSASNFQLKILRRAFSSTTAKRMLPWWKWRKLRSNPYNAKGELCTKKD